MSIIDGLPTEWLGSITEKLITFLVNHSVKDKIQFQEFLVKNQIMELEDSFKSIYVFSVIEYTDNNQNKSYGRLFTLEDVVEKFKELYYGEFNSKESFQHQLITSLSFNAHKSRALTELYYQQRYIDFNKEINEFIKIFNSKTKLAFSPSQVKVNADLNLIRERIEEISKELDRQKQLKKQKVNAFITTYLRILRSKINRIDFYGLAVPSINRPNEIALEKLFVEPSFFVLEVQSTPNVVELKDFISSNKEVDEKYVPSSFSRNDFVITENDFVELIDSTKFTILADDLEESKEGKSENPSKDNNNVEFQDVFSLGSRIVILGNPGAGKSSLLKFLILSVINKDYGKSKGIIEKFNFPILVPLKDYHKFKKDKRGGLIKFILLILSSDYLIEGLNSSDIEFLLIESKSLICFDGLDEIFDKRERRDIKNDIVEFSKIFINSSIIVTSRYESYNEVSFQEEYFKELGINGFDDVRLNDYVEKWFNFDIPDQLRREEKQKKFLHELDFIRDELKRNPLLLSLILIIYKYENTLPKSKLEIYESCSKTLIQRRDIRDKKLEFVEKIRRKMALFAELAFWQYTKLSEKKEEQINYNTSKVVLRSFFIDRDIIDDFDEAENAAEEFLEFAKLRSIYFENEFTHKTFLEYLTAHYIFINYHSKGKYKERNELISKYINRSFWSIVIELLILKIDKESPDFEVMDDLFLYLLDKNEKSSLSFLIFVFDNFYNISKTLINKIVNLNIDYCLNHVTKRTRNESVFFEGLCEQIRRGKFLKYYKENLNKRFQSILEEVSHEDPIPFKGQIENIVILDLEMSLHTESTSLIDYSTFSFKSSYVFLLQNLSIINYNSWDDYIDLLNDFKSKFQLGDIVKSYSSYFGKKHFSGSSVFNWLFFPLFSHDSIEYFIYNYEKLREIGISAKLMENSIKKATYQDNMSPMTKLQLARDPKYKKLLTKSLPKNYRRIDQKKNRTPFYHQFIYSRKDYISNKDINARSLLYKNMGRKKI